MMRMIRAALIGIVIGVIGGAIIGQVYYIRYLYNKIQTQRNETSEAINALVYSNETYSMGEMELFDIYSYYADGEDQIEKTGVSLPDVIQLDVIYNGEELTAEEISDLKLSVKQAVLYALAEKLGEDYNQSMTKEEVRKNLILSMEYINKEAKESAKEWGIDVESRSIFDVQYMQENDANGILCPAGYYEVLDIYLME